MKRPLIRLFRDEAGNALVETAIAAPFFAALLTGAADMSSAYAQKIKIQQAAARSIELATASGYNGSAFSTIQADAATAAGVNASDVVVDKWLECAGVRQTDFAGICATGQLPARYGVDQRLLELSAHVCLCGEICPAIHRRHDRAVRLRCCEDPMTNARIKILSDERGAAAVEFVIAVPVVLMMIFGIMQISMVLFAQAGLREAVEAGARYATIYPSPSDEQIIAKVNATRFGLDATRLSGPNIVHGTTSGVHYVDVSMTYTTPLNFVFFHGPTVTLNKTRRAYQP